MKYFYFSLLSLCWHSIAEAQIIGLGSSKKDTSVRFICRAAPTIFNTGQPLYKEARQAYSIGHGYDKHFFQSLSQPVRSESNLNIELTGELKGGDFYLEISAMDGKVMPGQ